MSVCIHARVCPDLPSFRSERKMLRPVHVHGESVPHVAEQEHPSVPGQRLSHHGHLLRLPRCQENSNSRPRPGQPDTQLRLSGRGLSRPTERAGGDGKDPASFPESHAVPTAGLAQAFVGHSAQVWHEADGQHC